MIHLSNHRLVRKFRRNLDDYGIRIALKKGFFYLSKGIFVKRTYRIYTIVLDDRTKPPGIRDDISFFLMDDSNRSEDVISQIEFSEEWLEGEIESKLRNGSLCQVAMDGEKVAGFNLVSFGDVFIPLIEDTMKLKPEEAWSEHIAVFKNYRRRRIAQDLRYNIFDLLKKRGIRRFSGGTLIHNASSLKLARSVGFKEAVDIHFLKVLGRKWLRCESLTPPVLKVVRGRRENACKPAVFSETGSLDR